MSDLPTQYGVMLDSLGSMDIYKTFEEAEVASTRGVDWPLIRLPVYEITYTLTQEGERDE